MLRASGNRGTLIWYTIKGGDFGWRKSIRIFGLNRLLAIMLDRITHNLGKKYKIKGR